MILLVPVCQKSYQLFKHHFVNYSQYLTISFQFSRNWQSYLRLFPLISFFFIFSPYDLICSYKSVQLNQWYKLWWKLLGVCFLLSHFLKWKYKYKTKHEYIIIDEGNKILKRKMREKIPLWFHFWKYFSFFKSDHQKCCVSLKYVYGWTHFFAISFEEAEYCKK